MGEEIASRIRLAAIVGLASILTVALLASPASPGAQADGQQLRPDLTTLPIKKSGLVIAGGKKRRQLRLSNEIGNHGAGPLHIVPGESGTTGPCADGQYDAVQTIFKETNGTPGFQRPSDTDAFNRRFGCMSYHSAPGHEHWHVLAFARYELRRASKGKRVDGNKVGFCVVDSNDPYQGLPGSPRDPYYGVGCGGPGRLPTQEGLSVGWSDIYFFGLPGQALDLRRARRGRYCLTSTADPLNQIFESNERNNTRTVRLKLRPKKRKLKRLKAPCR